MDLLTLPPEHPDPADLAFVYNPNHKQGFISRFHVGVIANYAAEYDLERYRFQFHLNLPSRLHAMYLFASREDAIAYQETHRDHVHGRILKRCVTASPYAYSRHDLAWIDFLRVGHSMDADTLNFCWRNYWTGNQIEEYEMSSMGQTWQAKSIDEVLFYGRVNFPDRDLSKSD